MAADWLDPALFVFGTNPFWLIASEPGWGNVLLGLFAAFVPGGIAWARPIRDRARYSIVILCALSIAYGGWVVVLVLALIAPRAPTESEVEWPKGVPEP